MWWSKMFSFQTNTLTQRLYKTEAKAKSPAQTYSFNNNKPMYQSCREMEEKSRYHR